MEKTQNKLKIYNRGLVGHLDDRGIIIDDDFGGGFFTYNLCS